jgi:broad specificity phosphatase PhoE
LLSNEVIKVGGLKERCFGIWENLVYSEIKDKYPELHDKWVKDWIEYKIPEGESAREAYNRNTKAVDEIISRHSEGKVLVVTHLGAARFIISYLLGMGIEGSWRFTVNNGTISTIRITDGFAVLSSLNNKK